MSVARSNPFIVETLIINGSTVVDGIRPQSEIFNFLIGAEDIGDRAAYLQRMAAFLGLADLEGATVEYRVMGIQVATAPIHVAPVDPQPVTTLSTAKALWQAFGDIPVDEEGLIEEAFGDFEVGTDRENVWAWFERTFPGFSLIKALGLS